MRAYLRTGPQHFPTKGQPDRPWAALWDGLYNHAYRMLNFALALSEPEPGREDRIAIMAGFHDLPAALDGDLVYLERAADLADEYLFGRARLGVPEAFKREVDAAFPLDPLIKPALKIIGRYMLRHPLKPLPMLRW